MEFTKPKKIFIVDDDLMLTEALSDYITRKVPHDVSIFHTGEECLKNISMRPEIVILDFHMNTIEKDAANGLQILEAIRGSFPDIRVIMLSSQERYSLAAQTIQKGAVQYVIKDDDAFEKVANIIKKI